MLLRDAFLQPLRLPRFELESFADLAAELSSAGVALPLLQLVGADVTESAGARSGCRYSNVQLAFWLHQFSLYQFSLYHS